MFNKCTISSIETSGTVFEVNFRAVVVFLLIPAALPVSVFLDIVTGSSKTTWSSSSSSYRFDVLHRDAFLLMVSICISSFLMKSSNFGLFSLRLLISFKSCCCPRSIFLNCASIERLLDWSDNTTVARLENWFYVAREYIFATYWVAASLGGRFSWLQLHVNFIMRTENAFFFN